MLDDALLLLLILMRSSPRECSEFLSDLGLRFEKRDPLVAGLQLRRCNNVSLVGVGARLLINSILVGVELRLVGISGLLGGVVGAPLEPCLACRSDLVGVAGAPVEAHLVCISARLLGVAGRAFLFTAVSARVVGVLDLLVVQIASFTPFAIGLRLQKELFMPTGSCTTPEYFGLQA